MLLKDILKRSLAFSSAKAALDNNVMVCLTFQPRYFYMKLKKNTFKTLKVKLQAKKLSWYTQHFSSNQVLVIIFLLESPSLIV